MYAIVKGSDRTDKLEGNAFIANGGLHPVKLKVLINLKHYLGAQSQGHHTIDQREERAVEEEAPESAVHSQMKIGTVSQ